jgi:hypothetical protein
MTIGMLNKYGTWTGGEYYCASSEHFSAGNDAQYATQENGSNCNFPGIFWDKRGQFLFDAFPDLLHVEIDSAVWCAPKLGNGSTITGYVTGSASRHAYPLPQRALSAFNGLMTLTPIVMHILRPDGLYSPIGRVEHVRYANVLNHSPGDIIDIGGQRWMLFPWAEKGGPGDDATHHYGAAVKYDGP